MKYYTIEEYDTKQQITTNYLEKRYSTLSSAIESAVYMFKHLCYNDQKVKTYFIYLGDDDVIIDKAHIVADTDEFQCEISNKKAYYVTINSINEILYIADTYDEALQYLKDNETEDKKRGEYEDNYYDIRNNQFKSVYLYGSEEDAEE